MIGTTFMYPAFRYQEVTLNALQPLYIQYLFNSEVIYLLLIILLRQTPD